MERELIEIGGARIEVLRADRSAGPVVCAAHPAEAFAAATVALLQEVAGAAIICANARGLGGSSPGPAQTLEEMVEDLEAVRRTLGGSRWVFWGMSGGGWLGELWAARHPGALAGLVLESACACFRARLADPACILSPYHLAWRASLSARDLIDPAAHEVAAAGDTEWIEVPEIGSVFRRRGGAALLVSPMAISARMRETMPALWAADARTQLARIDVPTLVLCGTADPVVPFAHARALHAGIRGARLVAVEGAGHVPTSTGNGPAAEAVRAFVREL
jgi:pimeloyl-ACP methyl ester carboxylesterase